MKKIILLTIILTILIVGCNEQTAHLTEECICDYCIKLDLEEYKGNYLFKDDLPLGIIEYQYYSYPITSTVRICENMSLDSGECEGEILRLKLAGKC